MPQRKTELPKCSYIGLKGLCGKPCFRGLCSPHRNRKSLALCSNCGVRGTTSKTGVCAALETGCRWKAQVRCHKMKAAADDMDAYVVALIDSFEPSSIV
jgi:hypothetical protein